MSAVVVSHAYDSNATSAWYPSVRARLEPLGHTVSVPDLPEPQAPRPAAWVGGLAERTSAAPPGETVLVGHSIGGVNVLRFLEQHPLDRGVFGGVVLVATPAHEVGYAALAEFFDGPFDWTRIARAARRFSVLVAADDPVLTADPFEHAAIFVRELNATATVLPHGGHFMEADLPGLIPLVRDSFPGR